MSETEADRAYYAAGEAAFVRRRGTPFLLSPRDFALLKEWRALGVPIAAIEQGIDDAFSRREERSATGRVNSLAYCRDAVLLAWERRAETAVGRGTGRGGGEAETSPAVALEGLRERLGVLSERRPDLGGPLESAARSLARLAGSGKRPPEIEESLARLDRKLAGALLEALPTEERRVLEAKAGRLLEKASTRMDPETAEQTARALVRRALREKLDLPRLSLLG
jgi:hypothetical protein